MKTIVTRSAIKDLINELLDDVTSGAAFAIKPNNVVDPSASETDPTKQHKPQNKVELGVAVKQLTKDMPDTEAQRVYDELQSALNKDKDKDKDKDENSEMKQNVEKKVEETIRRSIRHILKEEWEAYDAAVNDEEQPKKKPQDDDQSFVDIAKELGMSIAGAKQFVDKAMARWKFLSTQRSSALKSKSSGGEDVTTFEPGQKNLEDLDVLILKAWSEYIDLLNSSGELTSADVQLMHDHPEVALELDGFREYLSEYIMGTINPVDAEGDSWLGKYPGDVDPELNASKPEGKRSGVRTFQNAPGYEGNYDWLEPEDDSEEEEGEKIRRKASKRAIKSAAP